MDKYGSDKPDLRFDLSIKDISSIVDNCDFSVFAETIKKGGLVKALKVDGGAMFTRKEIDEMTDIAKKRGAKGLAYLAIKNGITSSPFAKFMKEEKMKEIISFCEAKDNDLIFFVADEWKIASNVLGVLRNEIANKMNLKDDNLAAWAWIVDFPMYEYSEIEEGKIDFSHNPFSMPQGG